MDNTVKEIAIRRLKVNLIADNISSFIFRTRVGKIYFMTAKSAFEMLIKSQREKVISSMAKQLDSSVFESWRENFEADNENAALIKMMLPAVGSYVILSFFEKEGTKKKYGLTLARYVLHDNGFGVMTPAFEIYSIAEDAIIYKPVQWFSIETNSWKTMNGAWRPVSLSEFKTIMKLGLCTSIDENNPVFDLKGCFFNIGLILDTRVRLKYLHFINMPDDQKRVVVDVPHKECHLHGIYDAKSCSLCYSNEGKPSVLSMVDAMSGYYVFYRGYKNHEHWKYGMLVEVLTGKNGKTLWYNIGYSDGCFEVDYPLTSQDVKEVIKCGNTIKGLELSKGGRLKVNKSLLSVKHIVYN